MGGAALRPNDDAQRALGAAGPAASQLEMRETLDHAIGTLRPR